MNRLLYQLSYAAMGCLPTPTLAEISFIIISKHLWFVKRKFAFFRCFLGNCWQRWFVLGFLQKIILFFFGGGAYVGLELLWRGRSHGSMFLAGGLCFLLLGRLLHARPRLPLPLRGFVGAGIITMVELLMGLLFNREYRVWDYRHMPLHFHGQICLPFFFLWVPVSLLAMGLYALAERTLKKLR